MNPVNTTSEKEAFRTKRGQIVIKGDRLYRKEGVKGVFKRTYEGSKLLSLGLTSVILLVIFFTLSGNFILQTIIITSIIISVVILLIQWVQGHRGGFQRFNEIPIEDIKKIEYSESRFYQYFLITYYKSGNEERAFIQFPPKFFPYTENEVAKAKKIFNDRGVDIEGL